MCSASMHADVHKSLANTNRQKCAYCTLEEKQPVLSSELVFNIENICKCGEIVTLFDE